MIHKVINLKFSYTVNRMKNLTHLKDMKLLRIKKKLH